MIILSISMILYLILGRKVLATLIVACVVTITDSYSQSTSQPNIIWIIAEDLSLDLGCYGAPVNTPTIDRLASEGIMYTNMFTTAGVCAPSRTAIATGMYQTSIGAMHLRYPENLMPNLPDSVLTVEQILQENGYQTVGIGKDDYMFYTEGNTFQYQDFNEIDKKRPVFAKISSKFTHRDFEKIEQKYIRESLIQLPPYFPNVEVLKEDWGLYLENVRLLDIEVNEILEQLESKELLDNAIIFFFSDHGRPFLRSKYWNYDSGIRIPFIIYFSNKIDMPNGFEKGKVSNQLLSSIDISATTLTLAGIEVPDYMEGNAFLNEQDEFTREFVFSSIDRIGGSYFKTRSVRSKKFKYIRNFNNGLSVLELTTEYGKAKLPDYCVVDILDNYNLLTDVQKTLVRPLPREELYDVENDPFEINNLANDPEFLGIRIKMERILMDWIYNIDDKGLKPDSREIEEYFINYRNNHKERFRQERLNNYIKIKNKLIENEVLQSN